MTQTIRRPSALPILGIGAVWLLYGLLLPLYRPWHLLIPAVLSVLVFFVLRHFFPGREITVRVRTGDEQLDELLEQADAALTRLRAVRADLSEPALAAKLDEIVLLAGRILEHVAQNPDKLPQIRRFLNYYLPTTTRLLEQYRVLHAQGLREGSVDEAMDRVEGLLDTIVLAFRHQLDALFEREAMDISAEIQVLEQLMKAQGILQTDDFKQS